jgi:dTDP-4-dehydrorhamnose reductase
MKIWICGGSGMLGSHFTRLLRKRKIPFIFTNSKELDITHLDSVSDFVRIQKITHIINCAAFTNVDQAESDEKQAYLVNAVGAHNLGVAGRRHGAHVTHFSSDYVFDGKSRIPYEEDHPCSPIGAYGISKLLGEVKLLDEHSRSCIIRTSWLFGFPGRNFVETMLRLMAENEELKVVIDQIGRPTFCDDLTEASLKLLNAEGIFHFANSQETSWHGFAEEIYRQAQALGMPLKVNTIKPISSKEYPTKAVRPAYSTLSTKKIEGHLNTTPRPWQEALNDYLIQSRKHPEPSGNKYA